MADVTLAYEVLRNVWNETTLFSLYWILNAVLSIVISYLITSDKSKMPITILPASILLHVFGIPAGLVWYIIVGILFVVSAFSVDIRGDIQKINSEARVYGKKRSSGLLNEKRLNLENEKMLKYLESFPDMSNSTILRRKK